MGAPSSNLPSRVSNASAAVVPRNTSGVVNRSSPQSVADRLKLVMDPNVPPAESLAALAGGSSPGAYRMMATGRLYDAELAAFVSLRQGPSLAVAKLVAESGNSTGQLTGSALEELMNWLQLLDAILPSAQAREDLRALRAELNFKGHSLSLDAWDALLENRNLDRVAAQTGKKPDGSWEACAGYTCGLWTLFHVLAATAVDLDHGNVAGAFLALRRRSMAHEVLPRIRSFAESFFGCRVCSEHFVQIYDSCRFGRCDLDPKDSRGASLWLWQVHNSVSARVRAERTAGLAPGSLPGGDAS